MAGNADSRLLTFYVSAMHDLSRSLQPPARGKRRGKPLADSLYRILGTFAIGRGAVLLLDDDSGRLELAVAKGMRKLEPVEARISAATARKLAGASRPFKPNLPPGGMESLAAALLPVAQQARLKWVVPLATGSSFVGLLLLGDRISGKTIDAPEVQVLEEMGGLLALRIEEGRLRRRIADQERELARGQRHLRQIFMETIRALASVIDDPEPDGRASHSVRVASLSAEIGRRLRLPAETLERLYVAGLLHDIGKQVIGREILGKPAALGPEEREAIERHPAAGCDLIHHIRFPWGDVAEIIRHHHERLDGAGYPDRLSGDEFSLEAKILMMAEAFDSMASDQPWRPRLAMPKIVEQISRNLGIQFEAKVATALCEAVEAGLDAESDPPEFVPHLESAFDAALVRQALRELRQQLQRPSWRPAATIIEAAPIG